MKKLEVRLREHDNKLTTLNSTVDAHASTLQTNKSECEHHHGKVQELMKIKQEQQHDAGNHVYIPQHGGGDIAIGIMW